jgi:hypothetical protein
MITVSWLPYWDNPILDYASSRLRCLYNHQNLNRYHSDKYTSTIGISPDLVTTDKNILIITQKITDENLVKAQEFKNQNKDNIIIYDIVDPHYENNKVFNICDYIIVANDMQRVLISKHVKKQIFILPDPIDYEDQLDTNIVPVNNNIVWFGNNNSLNNIKSLLQYTIENKYVCNLIGQCNYTKTIPGANCIEWKYDNFISNLKQNSICLLTHDLKQQQKSNNKLLTAIANGVPILSYQSRSYEEILKKFYLQYAIIHNRQDLLNAIKILSRDENRQKYFENIQPYILENYNSRKITEKLVNILNQIDNPFRESSTILPRNKNLIIRFPKKVKPKPNLEVKKILVYTTNLNNYDNFTDILTPFHDYIDYLYITDKHIDFKNWKVLKIDINNQDPYMISKLYKILPHRFFPEYEVSVWIDASAINIKGMFHKLIEQYLYDYNFLICKHPVRKCVYEEAIACLKSKKDTVEKITNQINRYKEEDFPSVNGLFSCGFLIRNHNEIKDFSESWWEEINNNSRRDQISFPYIYEKFKDIVKLKIFEHKHHVEFFDWRRHGSGPLIPNQNQILHKKNRLQAWGRK